MYTTIYFAITILMFLFCGVYIITQRKKFENEIKKLHEDTYLSSNRANNPGFNKEPLFKEKPNNILQLIKKVLDKISERRTIRNSIIMHYTEFANDDIRKIFNGEIPEGTTYLYVDFDEYTFHNVCLFAPKFKRLNEYKVFARDMAGDYLFNLYNRTCLRLRKGQYVE